MVKLIDDLEDEEREGCGDEHSFYPPCIVLEFGQIDLEGYLRRNHPLSLEMIKSIFIVSHPRERRLFHFIF